MLRITAKPSHRQAMNSRMQPPPYITHAELHGRHIEDRLFADRPDALLASARLRPGEETLLVKQFHSCCYQLIRLYNVADRSQHSINKREYSSFAFGKRGKLPPSMNARNEQDQVTHGAAACSGGQRVRVASREPPAQIHDRGLKRSHSGDHTARNLVADRAHRGSVFERRRSAPGVSRKTAKGPTDVTHARRADVAVCMRMNRRC